MRFLREGNARQKMPHAQAASALQGVCAFTGGDWLERGMRDASGRQGRHCDRRDAVAALQAEFLAGGRYFDQNTMHLDAMPPFGLDPNQSVSANYRWQQPVKHLANEGLYAHGGITFTPGRELRQGDSAVDYRQDQQCCRQGALTRNCSSRVPDHTQGIAHLAKGGLDNTWEVVRFVLIHWLQCEKQLIARWSFHRIADVGTQLPREHFMAV